MGLHRFELPCQSEGTLLSVLVKNIIVENPRWQYYGEYGSYVGSVRPSSVARTSITTHLPSLLCSDSVALRKADSAGEGTPNSRLTSVTTIRADANTHRRRWRPIVVASYRLLVSHRASVVLPSRPTPRTAAVPVDDGGGRQRMRLEMVAGRGRASAQPQLASYPGGAQLHTTSVVQGDD